MDWSDAPPEAAAWLAEQQARVQAVVEGAAGNFCVLDGNDDDVDPRWCIELGYLIMFDKPIFIMKPIGAKIPLKLRTVADVICDYDPSRNLDEQPDVMRKVQEFATANS